MSCLPPPYWQAVAGALSASGTIAQAAELVLVALPYNDPLVLSHFAISLPDDAIVTGIEFQVRRATLAGDVVDDTVQVLENGAPIGANHASSDPWPALPGVSTDLTQVGYARYGGANDTWGVAWTPADLRADGFGLSIAGRYTGPAAGNERAYVDSVRVTVSYTTACD
jgi:hypothetical protein